MFKGIQGPFELNDEKEEDKLDRKNTLSLNMIMMKWAIKNALI